MPPLASVRVAVNWSPTFGVVKSDNVTVPGRSSVNEDHAAASPCSLLAVTARTWKVYSTVLSSVGNEIVPVRMPAPGAGAEDHGELELGLGFQEVPLSILYW